MSSRNLWLTVVVVLILLIGGYYIVRKSSEVAPLYSSPSASSMPSSSPSTTAASPSASVNQVTISISSTGFSPASVTIKAGDTVTWVNTDTAPHQVNSNPHPTHTDYPPLNTIGLRQPGDKKSLTFPTPGTYGFHDHLNPQFRGTVTVQ